MAFNCTSYENADYTATETLVYGTKCLVTFGIVVNLLTLYVCYAQFFFCVSFISFIVALAIADLCNITMLIVKWLELIIKPVHSVTSSSKLFAYFSYVASSCSAWIIVAHSLLRALAIMCPQWCVLHCTLKFQRMQVLGIILMSFVVYIPIMNSATAKLQCIVDLRNMVFEPAFLNYIDTMIPFGISLMCNICIVIKTWSNKPLHNLSKWMFINPSIYIVLNIPDYVFRMIAEYYGRDAFKDNPTYLKMQDLASFLNSATFGLNVLLIFYTDEDFRQHFYRTFPWIKSLERCWTKKRTVVPEYFEILHLDSSPRQFCTTINAARRDNEEATELEMVDLNIESEPGSTTIVAPTVMLTDGPSHVTVE